ncbi:MAG TPA: hypothetical protein VFU61_01710 [Steroidobacteraceae bacterium]|nr:hypothetical protein [Steroidobacteraceae bacterium]
MDVVMTERQQRISMEIRERTGIDEAMIDCLVRRFYGKVREDEVLAPVFNERVADWGRTSYAWANSGHPSP